MTRRQIVAGVSGAAVGVLLSLPVYAYQGVPESGGVNGDTGAVQASGGVNGDTGAVQASGGVNGDTGAVQASTGTSVLPNTSAVPPALNVTGLVIAGGAAGGGLLLLAGLGLARRRRTS